MPLVVVVRYVVVGLTVVKLAAPEAAVAVPDVVVVVTVK